MQRVQIVITGDIDNPGSVQVTGPILDMRIMHWLLGEAKRLCERDATAREAKAGNGAGLVVAHTIPKLD